MELPYHHDDPFKVGVFYLTLPEYLPSSTPDGNSVIGVLSLDVITVVFGNTVTVLTLDNIIVVVEITILFDDSAVLFGVLLCVADGFV